jgi:hypothetical protein
VIIFHAGHEQLAIDFRERDFAGKRFAGGFNDDGRIYIAPLLALQFQSFIFVFAS